MANHPPAWLPIAVIAVLALAWAALKPLTFLAVLFDGLVLARLGPHAVRRPVCWAAGHLPHFTPHQGDHCERCGAALDEEGDAV